MRSFGCLPSDTLEDLVIAMMKMSAQLNDTLVSSFEEVEIVVSPGDEFGTIIEKYHKTRNAVTVETG